jgi:O-succinylbenzoate synthase
MLRLEDIVLREIRLPLREPFRISSGVVDQRRIGLLQMVDADGVTAWSECVAGEYPNYSPETIDTAWHAIVEWIAPRVLGRSFNDPREIFPVLERDFRGHLMAKAAVEMGAWVLAAERLGTSLANLLGGTRTEIATGISLGIQRSAETLVEKSRAALALGYRKVKIKIAPGMDVDYLGAVRQAVGATAPLMADANNAYTPADSDHLARLDGFDLMMIEQPFAFDDLVQHAQLQRRLRTPICLDESITSLDRVRDMVMLGSGRIVNIKPGRVGGFAASLAIHAFCEMKGIPVWCGGMLESGIGRACNVALASLRNFTKPGDVSPSGRYWERDIVSPEWTMSADGMVRVPFDRRGLGVDVDVARVDDLTVRMVKLSAPRSRASAEAVAG